MANSSQHQGILACGPSNSTRSTFWVLHKLSNVHDLFLGVHSIHAGELHGAEGNAWFQSSLWEIASYLVHTCTGLSGLVSSESNLAHPNYSCSMKQRNVQCECWQLGDRLQKYSPALKWVTANPPNDPSLDLPFTHTSCWSCHMVGCCGTGGRGGTLLHVHHHREA